MPVELSSLLGDKHWLDVEMPGGVFHVAYRPGATSLKRQAQLQKRMRQLQAEENPDEERIADEAAGILCEIICDWDLAIDGKRLPIDVPTVVALPNRIYNAIMEAINGDGQSSSAEKKVSSANSAAGSPAAAKSAVALNGIPQLEPRGTWA